MANKVAYHNMVIDVATGQGKQAEITVYDAGTVNLSTIYSDPEGTAKANPFSTDSNGRFVFYADPGEYDIQVSGVGITTYKLEDVSIIGIFTQFVTSNPPVGDRAIKKIRLDTSDKIVVVYNSIPEA